MTDEEYQRALDARDPRGVEMIEELVRLAMEAITTHDTKPTLRESLRERFAQFAQAQCFALDEAERRGAERLMHVREVLHGAPMDTRNALPDVCDDIEPALGDVVHDRNFRHDSLPPEAP